MAGRAGELGTTDATELEMTGGALSAPVTSLQPVEGATNGLASTVVAAANGKGGKAKKRQVPSGGEKEDKKEGKPPAPKSVWFHELFSFADPLDYALMAAGCLGAVAHGAALPVFFLFFGKLINSFGDNNINDVQHYTLLFVYLGLVVWLSGWAEVAFWMWSGERQAARMRARYLRALLKQEVAFFDTDRTSGEVVSRVSSDVLLVQDAISEKVGNFLHFIATFVAGFIVAFTNVWKLALVVLGVMPAIVVAGGLYAYNLIGLTTKAQAAYAKAGLIAEQAIGQVRTVYSFGGEERAAAAYSRALENTLAVGVKAGFAKGLGMGSTYGILFCCWALNFWFASTLIAKRHPEATGGKALTTMFGVILGAMSLGQAMPNMTAFGKGTAAAYGIFDMLARRPAIDSDDLDGKQPAAVGGGLELRDVHFAYPSRPEQPIFQGFSLTIPEGKTVAIVGASGSGKSTVIALIERFYDPIQGAVLLDGVDVRQLQLKWLRRQLGLVSQEPALFATSIMDNILYGKEGATKEEVIEAAKAANAHNFISALPQGYDTQVGERGVQMSGGQKQRIAIARAVVRAPSILLLDEATSALDFESERVVQAALDGLMVNRTTVVVAHRLSTIRGADAIAVISEGRLVEQGRHDELLAKGPAGAYYSLVQMQQQGGTGGGGGGGSSGADAGGQPPLSADTPRKSTSLRQTSNLSSLSRLSNDGAAVKGGEEAAAGGEDAEEGAGGGNAWGRLFRLCLPDWPATVLATAGAAGSGCFNPLFGLFLATVVYTYYDKDFRHLKYEIHKWCIVFVVLAALAAFAYTVQHYFFGVLGERLIKRIREMMFATIMRNEVGWFDRDENSSGAIAGRLAADATLLKGAVADRISVLVQNTTLIIVAFVIGFTLEWRMTFVVIATFPLLIGSAAAQQLFMKGFAGDVGKAHAKASQVAAEAVGSIRTVAAFGAEDKVLALFERHAAAPLRRAFVRGQVAGVCFGASQFVLYSSFGLALWYGSTLVSDHETKFGNVLKVFLTLIITSFGIAETLALAPDLIKGGYAVRSVFVLLDRPTRIEPDDAGGAAPERVAGDVALRHVRFAYPSRPDVVVFEDFNLHVHAGQTVALVGASGSGKSSVIALIERFYDPLAGSVSIDGADVRTYNLRKLRAHIGLVSQEPALFATTIRENILYGRENASEAEVVEAAKAANAHNFISSLPDGYDTDVGDRGVQLSGGQKQRVAIARAVLKNPSILLLDEATSALDSESERVVQEALDRLMVGRTTVVIAHRLSTIRHASVIAVVQEGRVIEKGSHDELLAQRPGGAYASLLNLQHHTR